MEKVLIVGSGGREHALARAFSQSSQVSTVFVAPGNAGMVSDKIQTVALAMDDSDALLSFAQEEGIALTFVGAERPLEAGLVDAFRAAGLAIVGPTKYASQLESSKAFAKEVMHAAQVPTSSYEYFNAGDMEAAWAYLEGKGLPAVIKVDGLYAGKGVVIPESMAEAQATLERFLVEEKLPVIIEDFMVGPEFSYFTLINGTSVIPVGSACDYKRVSDNDQGLNTGGMGAFSPVPWFDEAMETEVLDTIVRPVAEEMVRRGEPFTGVLYSGLMLTAEGLKVVEFNTRFGDPETQILLPRIQDDFYDLIQAHLAAEAYEVNLSPETHLGIIVAAEGYPEAYAKGMPIRFTQAAKMEDIYFAGVQAEESGTDLVANGGRILMVTAEGANLSKARQAAYAQVDQVNLPQSFYRSDIGLHRERSN